MAIADMDFRAPDAVLNVLKLEAQRGVFGYYGEDEDWRIALSNWLQRRHDWNVNPSSIVPVPNVATALALAIRAFTDPGDSIAVFAPAYPGFWKIIAANGRNAIPIPLSLAGDRYEIPRESIASDPMRSARMLIFCNPHNPGGRAWSTSELGAVIDACKQNGQMLISDDVHNDLVFPPARYTPMAKLTEEFSGKLVTLVSPAKTFNLSSMLHGAAIIDDPSTRSRFEDERCSIGAEHLSRIGMIASQVAYEEGDEWLDALVGYLSANRDFFRLEMQKLLPQTSVMDLDATYLPWVGFHRLSESADLTAEHLLRAGVLASDGRKYGPGGEGYFRFNLARSRGHLREAIHSVYRAIGSHEVNRTGNSGGCLV